MLAQLIPFLRLTSSHMVCFNNRFAETYYQTSVKHDDCIDMTTTLRMTTCIQQDTLAALKNYP